MLIQRRSRGGDELRLFAALAPTVMGSPREELAGVLRAVGAGTPPWSRLNLVGQALTDLHGKERTFSAHCEVAVRFASRMGLPQGVVSALAVAYARWDGRGVPAGMSGADIPVAIRLAVVAHDVELLVRTAGVEDAERILHERRGTPTNPTSSMRHSMSGSPPCCPTMLSRGTGAFCRARAEPRRRRRTVGVGPARLR